MRVVHPRPGMLGGDVSSRAEQMTLSLDEIIALSRDLSEEDLVLLIDTLPPHIVTAFWDHLKQETDADDTRPAPPSVLAQAQELDPKYRERDHLVYLSTRIAKAVEDVENGINRMIVVSMPPRSGKSEMSSVQAPTWILRKHPDWKIGLISHAPSLAVGWGRKVQNMVVSFAETLGIKMARGQQAVQEWYTTEGGMVVSRSLRESITGLGFKVLIMDDLVKDFADAHSETQRNAVWDWWGSTAFTRLEEPYLVIAIGTRWHEDDFIGRLLSKEYEGDPDDWEVIEFPAIAEEHDVLGREPGQPLYTPLIDETEEQALARWAKVKRSVGTYAWSALYQQRPSPSKGAIFNTDWWRYWTSVPALASKTDDGEIDPNGRIVLLDPEEDLKSATWLDSWDMAFKKTDDSDYVVGQRWAQHRARKFLIAQSRARMTFTQTVARVKAWAKEGIGHHLVHLRLVEDKANGTAVIDTLQDEIPGIVPVNPTDSKEARARAVTPDVEAGNVYLPLPSQEGNEWVVDLVSEFRDFPNGAHDDQVDAGTQALYRMRVPQFAQMNVPGGRQVSATRGRTAQTQRRISRANGR